ncbi:hypothetical protein LCI18_013969 [Fusarium solani-melongenae]|uniref:Uncharacterized protein n=1 Tax=Fusarium solani subsp. cucurbitae TaxID=2747967 RepID=A0ACD3ZNY0_FUSSC|nr:hypothetical protein LCI18_013969 [Fusarium solani-melongenae]
MTIQHPISNRDYTDSPVVIIGAGISGMCMAIDLITKKASQSFVILERSAGVGGTWRDNKYPGCCCDGMEKAPKHSCKQKLTAAVWSHLYSYSFEQNPDWSREYSGQEEILDYLQEVARKYNLYRYIRFNSSVEGARWDDASKRWDVVVAVQGGKEEEFGSRYTIKTDFLVSAVGQLNMPKMPEIEGLHDFTGKIMHSARWDWSYDLRDKKVAVIGSGSTGAQIVPEVAKSAASLTVYQRTPAWIVPRSNKDISTMERLLYRYLPPVRQIKRSYMMDFREKSFRVVVVPEGGVGQRYEALSRNHMKRQLPDRQDLWQKLGPTYKLGCKRAIVSDDYYPTFLRGNVRLETGHIDRISTRGVVCDQKEEQLDLIILATGFKTTQFMDPIEILGRHGQPLSKVWKDGAEAFNGVCVGDLPNFAMLYGPNTNLSHNSIILMIEAQSRYIATLIAEVSRARASGRQLVLEPKAQKVTEYNARIQASLAATNYSDSSCNSCAIFIACYPRPASGKSYRFDLDYYINVHMPLQLKHHGPYGLKSYYVIKPTEDAPYVVQTVEIWDNIANMEKGIAEASAALYEDIPNYTDIPDAFPIRAEIKASWSQQSKD